MIISKTTSEAYLTALFEVMHNYEYTPSPRGQKTREILDYTFRVTEPTMDAIVTNDEERNKTIKSYSDKEFEIYDSCTNKVEDFTKISKFWGKLANPDNTVNSAYGYLIWKNRSHGNPFFEKHDEINKTFDDEDNGILTGVDAFLQRSDIQKSVMRTPWEWAKESLALDKDTRQAILRFSLPEHQWHGNKDQTCTLHGNFQIRDNKLHLSVTMRSNDLMRGLVYDLPWFVSLMYKMRDELKYIYPNLEIGHYTHTSHSMHLYERDLEVIKKMIGDR